MTHIFITRDHTLVFGYTFDVLYFLSLHFTYIKLILQSTDLNFNKYESIFTIIFTGSKISPAQYLELWDIWTMKMDYLGEVMRTGNRAITSTMWMGYSFFNSKYNMQVKITV